MNVQAKKLFLILIGLNAVFVGGILIAFSVSSNTAQQKSQKISRLKADVEANDQALVNYKVLQSAIKSNKDLESIAQKVLPSDKDQSAALADIDKFSRETSTPVQQISFNTTANKIAGTSSGSSSGTKGVSVVAVVLHSNNVRYDNLLSFLKKIETTQRRMQVTSITITPNSTNPNLLSRVDLSIDIYVKPGT